MANKFRSVDKREFIELIQVILRSDCVDNSGDRLDQDPSLRIAGIGSEVAIGQDGNQGRLQIRECLPGEKRPSLHLIEPALSSFGRLVDLLAETEGIGNIVHKDELESALSREIQRIVADPPQNEESWEKRIRDFHKSLRGLAVSYKTYLPIMGLALKEDVTIGDVRLMTPATTRAEMESPMEQAVSNDARAESQNEYIVGNINSVMPYYTHSHCVACVSVKCESGMVKYAAGELVQAVVNLLRCYVPVLYGIDNVRPIGMMGEYGIGLVPYVAFDALGGLTVGTHNVDTYDFELNDANLKFMRKHGAFEVLSSILAKEPKSRSELEKALAIASWWIGSGNHRQSSASQAVALATAIEALLISSGEKVDIAETLAFRASFLLKATDSERMDFYTTMKELYGMRSQVVHSGTIDVKPGSLADLRYYALAILVEMAKKAQNGWSKVADLAEALKMVKFGGKSNLDSPTLIPRGPSVLFTRMRISSDKGGLAIFWGGNSET